MTSAGAPWYEHLQVAQDGHVATITFDRPEKLNAFTTQMLRDITAILRGFEAAGDVRACILRGRYWLYAVFDCGGAQPRLLRVQDPFAKLIAKARGSMTIAYGDIANASEAAE